MNIQPQVNQSSDTQQATWPHALSGKHLEPGFVQHMRLRYDKQVLAKSISGEIPFQSQPEVFSQGLQHPVDQASNPGTCVTPQSFAFHNMVTPEK
jgi:hypothetical protein